MQFHHSVLSILEDGAKREFFSFMRLGFNKPSYSNAFLSSLAKNRDFSYASDLMGEERACIQCGYCTDICPVEIMPDFLFKAVLAEEIDRAESLGLRDCVNCALCTYVCPSKIEINNIIKDGLKESLEG